MIRKISWNRLVFLLCTIVSLLMYIQAAIGMPFYLIFFIITSAMLYLLYRPGNSRLSLVIVSVGGAFALMGPMLLFIGCVSFLLHSISLWAKLIWAVLLAIFCRGLYWGNQTAVEWYEERQWESGQGN